jgi:hypothetical protein
LDSWNQWNIGNKERQIPPSRLVDVKEYQFLDLKAKSDEEKPGQRGNHINKRRLSRKICSDMKFLCQYIEQKASDAGLDTLDRSLKICEACLKRRKTIFERVQRVIEAINSSGKHL